MKRYYAGIDVSKGYVDVAAVNDSGSILNVGGRFDDTLEGHRSLGENLAVFWTSPSEEPAEIKVGLESSGGLERNWLKSLRDLHPSLECYLLNPLAVKKFGERFLHRNVTDRHSALNIAHYLRLGLNPREAPFENDLEGPRTFYRHVKKETTRCAEMKNELQCLLPSTHPELVQHCRNGLPDWVLRLLKKFPTVGQLAKAGKKALLSIPYVTEERAHKLLANAKRSVASRTDGMTGFVVKSLSSEILRQQEKIEEMKSHLAESMKDDEVARLWQTFTGIGSWTALCLRLEFGSVERFYSASALAAYCGLDPVVHQSGDTEKHRGISKRGRPGIRGILYMPIESAIRYNPVISEFYARLRRNGKTHLQAATACMRKTVTILYAMAITGKPFDPEYHKKLRREWEEKRKALADSRLKESNTETGSTPSCAVSNLNESDDETCPAPSGSEEKEAKKETVADGRNAVDRQNEKKSGKETKIVISAPVTRREAKKRREMAKMPHTALRCKNAVMPQATSAKKSGQNAIPHKHLTNV